MAPRRPTPSERDGNRRARQAFPSVTTDPAWWLQDDTAFYRLAADICADPAVAASVRRQGLIREDPAA